MDVEPRCPYEPQEEAPDARNLARAHILRSLEVVVVREVIGPLFEESAAHGSPSIKGSVLTAFRNISNDVVIWERGDKKWRKREFYDAPGRQQY